MCSSWFKLIEVYKVVHRLSAVPLVDLFEFENSGRRRGHSLKLRKKRCTLDPRLYFFSERVVNLWNSLDEQSVTVSSVNSFKNNLSRLRQCSFNGPLHGQPCSLTLEAAQFTGWPRPASTPVSHADHGYSWQRSVAIPYVQYDRLSQQ